MLFISMIKFKKQAKDVIPVGKQIMQNLPQGVKIIGSYWTLGKFDAVWIYEAPSEKEAMKIGVMAGDVMRFQTMTAVSREEAMNLLNS
ncbi:MAG: GYD domain-containing protein [Nitrosopumilaceae archaeon]|nr:GYD domain-containing protein [Nitrosopumilaceae archaeon]NIU00950.1 GYD domain-containing protein [Nitrosopumilaceae archaeon]NIU87408.1 GYD domain-containing protein [Nitrosopumilaceae archaeon]NIV65930.1 GYD domain-containing protein [Nitrosopumilaceae archaeon]NIX61552.1 GYD domain-containing protein [Nitrosopumilaceae archaeon]